jgi:putative membrane protein
MRVARVLLTGTLLLGLTAGCESLGDLGGKDSEQIAKRENDFFKDAATSDMLEIESSQLALERARSEQVRDFAQMMISDHTNVRAEMRMLTAQKDVELPKQMGKKNQAIVEELRQTSGRDFDRAYMQAQVTAHQEAINRYQAAAHNADDRDLKRLAQNTLPTLREHLRMAQRIVDQL